MADSSHIDYLDILVRTLRLMVASNFSTVAAGDLKWLRDTAHMLQNEMNPFVRYSFESTDPIYKLMNLLRESLLTQRWEEVLKILTEISKHRDINKYGHPYSVFTVALELSQHLEPCQGRILEQLIEELIGPTALGSKEIELEFILHLLSVTDNPDVSNAMATIQTFRRPKLSKKQDSKHMSTMFEAFKGLMRFSQWQEAKSKVDNLSCRNDLNFVEEAELQVQEKNAQILSERALSSFQLIKGQPGVWDIFITKYVMLLEWTENTAQAEAILQEYYDQNPTNPNACRYLLQHYKSHSEKEKATTILQALCNLIPSDEAVLDLVKHYEDQGMLSKCVVLLFDLLDYPCWKDVQEPWKVMTRTLLLCLKSDIDETMAECLQECWASRFSWWPSYHFNQNSFCPVDGCVDFLELLTDKAIIATIFHAAPDFVTHVRRMIVGKKDQISRLEAAARIAEHLLVEDVNNG